jgi:hypothetical protein
MRPSRQTRPRDPGSAALRCALCRTIDAFYARKSVHSSVINIGFGVTHTKQDQGYRDRNEKLIQWFRVRAMIHITSNWDEIFASVFDATVFFFRY